MKGPFATKDEAYAVAESGEVIMARDTFKFRGECWCVMSRVEMYRTLASFWHTWTVWEELK